uniref:Chromosome partition protein Smc n=1 Tax=mine drainage metagenome TaxID=410659 RepID=E6QM62_9ZZZZ
MSEFDTAPPRSVSGALLGLVAASLLAAVIGLGWSYVLAGRISREDAALSDANQQTAKLAAELRETNARLKVASEEMGQSLGLTQKQLEARAQDILRREQADNQRLETAQKATSQQVTAVSSEVSNVKTDVGGVKTDVAKTQSDLASAVSQMQSMKGDMGMQSGLIARNQDELDVLKHQGDRNYYSFKLIRGRRQPVATVSLELRRADVKHSRFTLDVLADDKTYEKKDRNVDEPLQFYTGKDPMLYEIVVNSIGKNEVSGYISTPKNAPTPITVSK